jgi:DNA-binding transcriptional regulator YdaS (Cro superfamily)
MPCFHCDEPEAIRIVCAFAQFGAAALPMVPRDTAPTLHAIADCVSEPEPEPTEPLPDPGPLDGLFMLRDYVIAEHKIMAAAIKAAGGIRILARKLGIHREVIEQWKRIPAERLQAAAKATGLPQHVLRPDLFDVGERQSYWTEEEEDEIWKWSRAWQLWLPLPYPPGFLPAHCCARRPRLTLVVSKN